MAQLLFTTDAFAPHGLARPGVPLLLDGEMRLIEPACAWLLHVALVRGRTRSPETWRTYGEVLYDWWQTLGANGWGWNEVGLAEVAAYRDRMLSGPSDRTGRPFARSTINGRIRTLALFYRWCVNAGLIERAPFAANELATFRSRPQGFLAHVDASGGRQEVNDMTVRHKPLLPRPLSPEVLRRVMGPMETRDRLIVEWAVTTGIRRMEVAGLRRSALPHSATEALTPIRIDATKGGNARLIYPPLPLVDRTRAYIREERAVVVRRAQARTADYIEPDAIFLTEVGHAMSPRRIGAMFSAAARAAQVYASFHALRHTFATTMLRVLQRRAEREPDLNPLLALQVLLGHADLATTAIYLRVLATDLTLVEASVDELYEALL